MDVSQERVGAEPSAAQALRARRHEPAAQVLPAAELLRESMVLERWSAAQVTRLRI